MAPALPSRPAPINWLNDAGNALGKIPGVSAGGKATQDVVGGVQDIGAATVATGKFLAVLTHPNTWVRVGEVVVGLILLGVGVDAMFKTSLVPNASKAATKIVPIPI